MKHSQMKHPYHRFLKVASRYWFKILAGISFMMIFVLLSGLSLGMLYPLAQKILVISDTTEYYSEPIPNQLGDLVSEAYGSLRENGWDGFAENVKGLFFDFLNRNHPLDVLKAIIFISIILFFFKSFVDYIYRIIFADVEQNVIRYYQKEIFNHFSKMSLDFFQKYRIGELTARITNDVNLIGFTALGSLIEIIRNSLLVLFYLAIALIINWKLTLIAFTFIPIMSLFSRWMSKRIKKYIGRSQETWALVSSKVHEIGTNIKVVLAFDAFKHEEKSFSKLTYRLKSTNFKRKCVESLARPMSDFINMGLALVLIWIGGKMVIDQTSGFSPPAFFVYLGAILSMMHPVKVVVNKWNELQGALVGLERVYTILDTPPTISDKPDAVDMKEFKEGIVFKNVRFSYVQGQEVLKGLSFEVKKGETIALVGRSGVGKTTILDLLMRFYDPDEGSIFIDGIDLKDIKLSSLRNLISSVTQEVLLFYDSVENNISYAKPGADFDEVLQASKAANAFEFIEEMPDGFKTVVGERGTRVSGGQRQRLAIARAILRDPEILIFDEATSSLDSESERKVQKSIKTLLKGRTAFVVAHRLSTIKNSKKIFVIEEGKMVECGSHDELYSKQGVYRSLYDQHELEIEIV